MERMNLDQIVHNLRFCGMTAYRQTLLDLAAQNNQLQEQIENLQNQLNAEIMARPASPTALREIVAELGNGWRIERQPAAPNASAATSAPPAARPATISTFADTWLPDDCWVQYFAAVGE